MKTTTYEVIADYPSSRFDKGETFKVYIKSGVAYVTEIDVFTDSCDVREFPHLFREVKNEL